MTASYTIVNTDNKEHLYFTAVGEKIEIIVPINNGSFLKDWSVMISLEEAISLELKTQSPDVKLLVDQPLITRPNDLFYLININGANQWKAIRAGNFALTTSNREIINEPKQLDSGSPIYQFIGANGGEQDVILPNPPATNDRYIIKNIFQDKHHIAIKEELGGEVIVRLGPSTLKYIAECIYDGEEWQIILM